MPAQIRRGAIYLPLLMIVLVAGFAWRASRPMVSAQRGPTSWQLLDEDGQECGAGQAGRDVQAAYWAIESGILHLRLCVAGRPGWEQGPGGWTDARYKWWLDTQGGRYLLLLEDYDNPMVNPGGTGADGQGELTLIDDRNGNGQLADDWAGTVPPAYPTNSIGSPAWRRSWSTAAGPQQRSSQGHTSDIGFQLGRGECGATVDIYIRLSAIGNPESACVQWATDAEGLGLDDQPPCDTSRNARCVTLAEAPQATRTPTATETLPPATTTATVPIPELPTATATDLPIPQPSPTTEKPSPTSPRPTATPTPSRTPTTEPTDTASPTPRPTRTRTPTPEPTDTPEPTATATQRPTHTASATPRPTRTRTATPEPTDTPEPTATATSRPTQPASATSPPTRTRTATPEPTDTPEPTATATPRPTRTRTPVPAPTRTDTPTAVAAATDTASPPATATRTATAGATRTRTATAAPTRTNTDVPPSSTPTSPPPTDTRTVPPPTATREATSRAPTATASATPQEPAPTASATACADAFEPDDQWTGAKVLLAGGGRQKHSFHRPGDQDYVKFVTQANRRVVLRTADLAAGVDTQLYLYDQDGQTLLTWNDDDPNDPPASRIEWDSPAAGTYYAKVTQLDPEAGGCAMSYGIEYLQAGAVPPSATPTAVAPAPTWTATSVRPGPPTRTSTPGRPTATPTRTPKEPTPTGPVPTLSIPTPDYGANGIRACVRAILDSRNVPFPDPATVHAVLLTPWGWPAAPPLVLGDLDPDGCVSFASLEPGQYRVWVTVPPIWALYPGTPPSQVVWVVHGQAPSLVVFRFVLCTCPAGGVPTVPPPPGPPGGTIGPPPVTIPTLAPPTPYPPSPIRPSVGSETLLPVLGYLGNDAVCNTWVEVQNVGDRPAKALLLVWGAPGFCPPQCTGPLKVECSGLLAPGSAWNFIGAQVPTAAKSGLVIAANNDPHGQDLFADALCEALFHGVVGNCDEYRRFRKAYAERGVWNGFNFGQFPCQPLAVEVLRNCPGDLRPDVRVTSSYAGIAGEFLGHVDPVYGGFAYFAPSLNAGHDGFTSVLYIQNAGLECTSVEVWFKAYEECLRPRICDILTLAPGESHQFDASSCLPAGWSGGAWVRSSQPLAIAVDHVGNDVLMTYTGMPAELNYVFNGQPLFTIGSGVAFGPLVYSEYQGWDTTIVVQNLSGITNAKVKVYFLDRSGGVITTVADWICPQGSQVFFLPVISGLPGNWVGSVRVESQDWFTPGQPSVSAPNLHAVAQLVHYADIARSEAQEAIAYNLFPESLAYDWQLGSGPGGLYSGVGRIGIPSFLKDRQGTGVTSELAIANIVPKPGLTNFAIFIYDQNGLIDYLCETLNSHQVEYIDLANWGFIHPGFKGSAIISATFWEHEVFDSHGGFARNVVGLAAVKVERSGTTLGNPIPGDESAGNEGFPIPGPFPFAGPAAPSCPGQPSRGLPPPPTSPPPGGTVPPPPGPPPIP